MELSKRYFLLVILLTIPRMGLSQDLASNLFVRTPQVFNYNFNDNGASYSPVLSIGAGLSHRSKFIELATYISEDETYGYYTFFGTTIKTEELSANLKLNTNWFGEITYVPRQNQNMDSLIYTSGICFFLNHSFDWGSIGIPLCLGFAYSEETISLNARTILNLSLNLN